MKHKTGGAAAVLAAVTLFGGCSSTDIRTNAGEADIEELVTISTTAASSVTVLPSTNPLPCPEPADSYDTAESEQQSPADADDDTAQEPTADSAEVTEQTTVPVTTTAIQTTAAQTAAQTTTAQTTAATEPPNPDNNLEMFKEELDGKYDLTDEELGFVNDTLFVGDSICSGFSEYGVIPKGLTAAKGSLGTRTFYDYTFKFRDKEDQTYKQVLDTAEPKYILLSMGMNDVNMIGEDTFCEDYRKIIDETLDESEAEIYVAAITPVCSKFCGNSVIDSFNDHLRDFLEKEYPERVHFLNFAQYLKNDDGKLRTCLHSGDGVHLGPLCYEIALWTMHEAICSLPED